MRSIFTGMAIAIALTLGACGQAAVGGAGKECKDLFDNADAWCKDAKDALKGVCDGQKTAIDTLKKTPNEDSCKAITTAIKTAKGAAGAGAVPAPATNAAPAGSAPAEGAGSAPTQ